MFTKKTTQTPSDVHKTHATDNSLFKFSLISLFGAVAGIAIAALLLYTLVINGSNRQLSASVFESHATAYANHFNQLLNQLQAHLTYISDSPEIIWALANKDLAELQELTHQITSTTPNLVSLRLLPVGEKNITPEQSNLSFPEIDMINRARQGQPVAAEAHTNQQQQVVRLVSAVKAPSGGSVIGVIIASYSLKALNSQLGNFNAANGAMQLQQVFSGSQPKSFIRIGSAFNKEAPVLSIPLNNPLWQVSFQPSAQLAQDVILSATAFWVPLGLALALIISSILFAYLKLRNSVRNDATLLVNYCRSLIQSENQQTPVFNLSLFDSIARTLAITDREQLLEPANAIKPVASAAPAHTEDQSDSLHHELEDDEILDLDLLTIDQPPTQAEPSAAVAPAAVATPAVKPAIEREVSASIFRAYDIRGIVGDTLDTDITYRIGKAVGSQAASLGENSIIVGADGRLSSPELSAALIQGLRDSGQNVINLGTVPTPLVYFATHCMETSSGIMITGSHNPADYNGFKIVIAGVTLADDGIKALYQRIIDNDFSSGHGELVDMPIIDNYIEHVSNDIALAKPLKVVVDCGNGVAAAVAPQLLSDLGCTVIPLYCEIDGRFPNHHPDPGKPENLQQLIAAVAEHNADIGIAFDGDGDRLGVVTNQGNIIWPDRLMMLFAKDVASRNPGADIIFDVKCSRRLAGLISNYGCRPIMWKTGHSLIKAKMQETGALLAGEMSGHIFFKERWFGFDDGIYSAARLLEIISSESCDLDTLFESFPDDTTTPEININVTDENKFSLVDQLQQHARFDNADISMIDGIRADFDNGWGLVRASNTTPVLVLRFGADDQLALEGIQALFKQQLLAVAPDLVIPF